MPATDIVRKNARRRDASQPPQGVPWRNVRSRHRQVPETLRRRSRHVERTVQFASIGAQCRNKPLSLLWKRETVSSLSKGKRRNGVGRLLAARRRGTLQPPGGIPQGRAAALPLVVSRGCGGKSKSPHASLFGGRHRFSLLKREMGSQSSPVLDKAAPPIIKYLYYAF